MPLTANRNVDRFLEQELRSYQVAANKHLYKGGFVGLSATGFAQPLLAGDPCVGIAYEEMDNTGGADGTRAVRIYTIGDFSLTLTGATAAHIGRPVFASADNVVTFSGAGNSYVGVVKDVITNNEIILRLDSQRGLIKTVVHAVEDLAAGVDIAARAIHHFDTDGWLVSARIVNQATAAVGIDNGNTCVVTVSTDAGSVISALFNATTPFPAANTRFDMGVLNNPHAEPGYVMTLSVINGATANPGPFLVAIDYV